MGIFVIKRREDNDFRVESVGEDSDAVKYVKCLFQTAIQDEQGDGKIASQNGMAYPIIAGIPADFKSVRNRIAIMTDNIAPCIKRGIQKGVVRISMLGKQYEVDVEMDVDNDIIHLVYRNVG